mgnify:CR=1 FL=1
MEMLIQDPEAPIFSINKKEYLTIFKIMNYLNPSQAITQELNDRAVFKSREAISQLDYYPADSKIIWDEC